MEKKYFSKEKYRSAKYEEEKSAKSRICEKVKSATGKFGKKLNLHNVRKCRIHKEVKFAKRCAKIRIYKEV